MDIQNTFKRITNSLSDIQKNVTSACPTVERYECVFYYFEIC